MATGLLVLVVGSATRLSSLLTGKDKTYEAEIRLGFGTTTDDAEGEPLPSSAGLLPDETEVRRTLETFLGSCLQTPPAHSAKKVGGQPAYKLARRQVPVELRAVPVTLRTAEWLSWSEDRLRVRIQTSAGFYVRALARDLGSRLGCGGHLSALRRTASGTFRVEDALTLDAASALGAGLWTRLVAAADALPELDKVTLNEAGLARIRHGGGVGPAAFLEGFRPTLETGANTGPIRVLDGNGRLVALGRWHAGVLHPVAVLG